MIAVLSGGNGDNDGGSELLSELTVEIYKTDRRFLVPCGAARSCAAAARRKEWLRVYSHSQGREERGGTCM